MVKRFDTAPILSTPRLRLRRLIERDLPAMLEIHRQPSVNAYIPFSAWRGLDDARQWFQRVVRRHTEGTGLHLAVTLSSQGERVIGSTLLFGIDATNGCAELGYVINPTFQRLGYAREAAQATLCHAFEVLDLRRIEATVDARNTVSHQLLLDLGFDHEGTQKEKEWCKGELVDLRLYAALRSTWQRPTVEARPADATQGR